jgi:hypothetical protein
MTCMLNSLPIHWVNKMKYLVVQYQKELCKIVISTAIGKFYGCFDNTLSASGH